ncbi:MAG: hypothetical protein WC374_13320 [Phycisphaerae bacterium]|jgi:hypothetical protein
MTNDQIKNLREALAGIYGPFAMLLPDFAIVNFRNNLQARINGMPPSLEGKLKPLSVPVYKPKNEGELAAYRAGMDCAKNGPNCDNSHYTYFATPELRKAWEAGKHEAGK